MKSIYLKKAAIIGNAALKPGIILEIPEDIGEKAAASLVKGGFAVDAETEAPAPEKEIEVLTAIEAAQNVSDVEQAVDAVKKPTPSILAAAESKIKSITKRPAFKIRR